MASTRALTLFQLKALVLPVSRLVLENLATLVIRVVSIPIANVVCPGLYLIREASIDVGAIGNHLGQCQVGGYEVRQAVLAHDCGRGQAIKTPHADCLL